MGRLIKFGTFAYLYSKTKMDIGLHCDMLQTKPYIIYVVKRRESRTGLGENGLWRLVANCMWITHACESRFFLCSPYKLILFFSDVPIGFVHKNEARTFSPCQIHGSLLLKLSVSTGRHARTALCCSHCVDFPLCCTLEDNSQHYKITLCIHSSTQ